MELNFGEWIEKVREKPEHIRRRYVFLCVAISMSLILGVWLLTVSESFQAISSDAGDATKKVKEVLPSASGFSIDSFLKSGESLGDGQKENMNGEEFYNSKEQEKTPKFFNEEGFQPKKNEAPNDSTAASDRTQ